jgi:replication-associated recombination protein RarA
MNNKENSLLNERYRPLTLDKFVGNEHLKTAISGYLEKNDILNFIFYGPAGCGKTTLAKLIVNNLDCDYLYINASVMKGVLKQSEIKYKGLQALFHLNLLK